MCARKPETKRFKSIDLYRFIICIDNNIISYEPLSHLITRDDAYTTRKYNIRRGGAREPFIKTTDDNIIFKRRRRGRYFYK